MVRATTSLETERFDLQSLPGGWVELRPMTYAQFLQRRDMAMKMGVQGRATDQVSIDVLQEAVTRFEFKVCIAKHNLEDENGRMLSLGTEADFSRLDPRVGQEISDLIDSMNQWEEPKSSGGSSEGDSESSQVP